MSRLEAIPAGVQVAASRGERARAFFSHSRFALVYLAAVATAELLTTYVDARLGLPVHAVILVALLLHAGLTWGNPNHALWLVLALAPLIRMLSMSLPLARVPLIYWYLATSVPLFLATVIVRRVLDMPWHVTFHPKGLPLQLLIGLTGVGLGYLEYLILEPEPLARAFTVRDLWIPALILLVCTGLMEELIFRGVVQRVAVQAMGGLGILYVSVLFAVLHVGYKSLVDVLFVFGVALFFSWVVQKTRSLVGVTLAHGVTNIVLFLVVPFVAAGPPAPTAMVWGTPLPPWPEVAVTRAPTATAPPTRTPIRRFLPTLPASTAALAQAMTSPSAVPTPLPTATLALLPAATVLPTDTATLLPTLTVRPTDTSTPLPTATAVLTETATPLQTATAMPLPTDTPTPLPTATTLPTHTATPLSTATARSAATSSPASADTSTPLPTVTALPTETAKPSPTATTLPAATSTSLPTDTWARLRTPTESPMDTATPLPTDAWPRLPTPTELPVDTATPLPTEESPATATAIPLPAAPPSPSGTATPSPSRSSGDLSGIPPAEELAGSVWDVAWGHLRATTGRADLPQQPRWLRGRVQRSGGIVTYRYRSGRWRVTVPVPQALHELSLYRVQVWGPNDVQWVVEVDASEGTPVPGVLARRLG